MYHNNYLIDMKEKLIEILKKIEDTQNPFRIKEGLEPYKITFFSGYKPANYFVPKIVFSTKQVLDNNDIFSQPAWFCEIFINNKCIIRECIIPVDETDEEIENKVLNNFFQILFTYSLLGEYDNNRR